MKLARLGPVGQEVPVLVDGDRCYDLRGLIDDITGAALAPATLDRIRVEASAGTLPELEGADQLRIGAPIARPSAVLCIGLNYAAHAAESGLPIPEYPVLFLKTPNTVVGPNDAVTIPRGSTQTDWEVELGVVIGTRALYLDSPADAREHIAGYVAVNDISERDWQLNISGGQWSKGKSAPGFTPVGPWLVTADDIDTSGLRLRSWVGEEPRQDSTPADMVFGVEHIIWHLSQHLALEPGDIVLTGTPEGVALSGRFPYLAPGDIVELEITGLGHQRQEFVGYTR